jgi:cell wall-associated NlpC family hydrolase
VATARSIAHRVRFLTLPLVAVLSVAVLGAVGRADPPMTRDQAKQKVAEINQQLGDMAEAYNKAKFDEDQAKAKASGLQAQIDSQQGKVDGLGEAVAEWAAAAYRGGRVSELTSLLETNSPQTFLDQMATLNHLSRQQRGNLNQLIKARRDLERQLTDAKAEVDKAGQARAAAEQQLANKSTLEGQRDSLTRQYGLSSRSTDMGTPPDLGDAPPPSGAAAVAVEWAKKALGKPYEWSADGPSSFDCSGLTEWAWRHAGVDLPHQSYEQAVSVHRIPISELAAGDLVFFGSSFNSIHHVGIYVGGGTMIHAPEPGESVKYAPVSAGGHLVAAGRP